MTWKFNGGKLPEFVYSKRLHGPNKKYVELIINEAEHIHQGLYSCHGEGNYRHYFVDDAELVVVGKSSSGLGNELSYNIYILHFLIRIINCTP